MGGSSGPSTNARGRLHWGWRLLPLALGFLPAVIFGLVAGWFLHSLVDLGELSWQTLVERLVTAVAILVVAALLVRTAFRILLPRWLGRLTSLASAAAADLRATPGLARQPEFWIDRVWPALIEGKNVVLAWLGAYGTMAAVIALAAILCQTGALAVAYLQIDRLDKQNVKIGEQIALSREQNELLVNQNELLKDQNLLSESARRAALLTIVGDVLAAIDARETDPGREQAREPRAALDEVTGKETVPAGAGANAQVTLRADERAYSVVPPRLVGRLAAACSSLRGYRYLGDDGEPIERPRSPERGFILRSVVAAGIDLEGLIDQRADFSFAEAENAVLEFYRLEPTPLAASSAPGARGLRLDDAMLEGIRFTGSRLGEASFRRAWLDNANFVGARLVAASFEQATARGAEFTDADLRQAYFSGADLTAADFSSLGILGDTLLPQATAFRMADLSSIELAGAFVPTPDWLDRLVEECASTPDGTEPTFARGEWTLVEAQAEPKVYHTAPELEPVGLEIYRWRVANPDGSLASSGTHSGTVITPRHDKYEAPPSAPRSK